MSGDNGSIFSLISGIECRFYFGNNNKKFNIRKIFSFRNQNNMNCFNVSTIYKCVCICM